jgi:hypothetical protein
MNWFEELTGIKDETPETVYQHLSVQGPNIVSSINGWRAKFGPLTTPALSELRDQTPIPSTSNIELEEVVADIQRLHMRPENEGATFQVASQFNLLEMMGPSFTPELGVGIYEDDLTQGPACAIACLAGTIYRNYFVPLEHGHGQTADHQINCLRDIATLLGADGQFLWEMRNGYALPTHQSLTDINQDLKTRDIDILRGLLRVGVQRDTEVTTNDAHRLVTQVYCSAMPVAYSQVEADLWAPLAQLILDAAYEATLFAAAQNAARTGNRRVFLTLLGGGAFGNRRDWISQAILRALNLFKHSGLQIFLVSYGQSSSLACKIISEFSSQD